MLQGRRATLFAIMLAAVIVLGISTTARSQQVVAFVNGAPITTLDVEHRAKFMQLSTKKVPARKEVVDSLINEILELNEAKRFGIEIPEAEVDKAFAAAGRRMGADAQRLTQALTAAGASADTFKRHVLPFAVVLTIASAVLTVSVNWVPLSGLAVMAVMFASGLALGASRTPRDVMLKDASPPGQIGKVFGFVSAGLPLGGALAPVPFGYLFDQGRPDLVLVLVACVLLISLLCVGTARASSERNALVVPAE